MKKGSPARKIRKCGYFKIVKKVLVENKYIVYMGNKAIKDRSSRLYMMMSHTVSVIGQMFHPPIVHRPSFHRGADLDAGPS